MSGLSTDDLQRIEQRHPCNEHQSDSAHIQPEVTNRQVKQDSGAVPSNLSVVVKSRPRESRG